MMNKEITEELNGKVVQYKPKGENGKKFKIKKVRNSGKIELIGGGVIPPQEFKMNWTVVD